MQYKESNPEEHDTDRPSRDQSDAFANDRFEEMEKGTKPADREGDN